jgi:RNA-directed DNA polymerase
MVIGANSPDDPSLQAYWEKRELTKIHALPSHHQKLAKRQDGKCTVCGESLFIEENIEQHHIMPRVAGGPDTNDNKIIVHLYCHQKLTAEQRKMGLLRTTIL